MSEIDNIINDLKRDVNRIFNVIIGICVVWFLITLIYMVMR